jgi:hypothetical protein
LNKLLIVQLTTILIDLFYGLVIWLVLKQAVLVIVGRIHTSDGHIEDVSYTQLGGQIFFPPIYLQQGRVTGEWSKHGKFDPQPNK